MKLLVYLCPSTPVATPRPDSPPSLQEGAWDALKTDELGRSWWQPDDAVQVMYRHLDPARAKWAAARLRPDADPGPYPLEAPPRLPSVYIYACEDEFFTPESRRWAARNIFGVEPIEMEGGHFPMLERPSELADLLVASLELSGEDGIPSPRLRVLRAREPNAAHHEPVVSNRRERPMGGLGGTAFSHDAGQVLDRGPLRSRRLMPF